jgi:carboxypeptidase Q
MSHLHKLNPFLLLFALFCNHAASQDLDSVVIKKLFNSSLTNSNAYDNLNLLCNNAPMRLAGSPNSFKALILMEKLIRQYAPDTVYHQDVIVHRWERGKPEQAKLLSKVLGNKNFKALAIGGSIPTSSEGIQSQIIEVHSLVQLNTLGIASVKGEIVFFNEPMDPQLIYTGEAYGKAGYQRTRGAIEASKLGAVGVLVRSLSLDIDDNPHTGILRYADTVKKIPAICLSTEGADQLHEALQKDPALSFYFKTNCIYPADTLSYNLIAELKGSEKPDEIITVGAHLDCWDICQGANDDGAGCIHVLETLHLFRKSGIKPRHTLRFVFFMDEEMNQTGAAAYADSVHKKSEKIVAAFESDSGGQLLMGFGCLGNAEQMNRFHELEKYFRPYGMDRFIKGHGDEDIAPLQALGIPLYNERPNSQRYFTYHHSVKDNMESISNRELQLGCAGISSLIYLIDRKNAF